MRNILLLLLFSAALSENHAQCLIPNGEPDTLFPVTNNYCLNIYTGFGPLRLTEASVTRMQKRDSSLFIAGNFTHIVSNHGKGIIVDENTKAIITARKWKIDGEVKAAIPDGQGGYYIAGLFQKVGDSTRRFIAQIDGSGRPTPWKLNVDRAVHALHKRNDTLFIGGLFTKIKSTNRVCFGAYSISGDSILPQNLVLQQNTPKVNVFKAYNDTLIIAGYGITKFNMKSLSVIPWTAPSNLDIIEIESLDISVPHRTLFFGSRDAPLTALDLYTGLVKYTVQVAGKTNSLLVVENRLYIGGYFDHVFVNLVQTNRKGLCAIDIPTGNFIDIDFGLDNHVTNLFSINDKIYVSGFFTSILGSPREHFAELDTGTLALSSWNPAPSDPVRCFLKSNGKIFFGGLLNGINAIRRNQLAEINMYTKELKPFSMSPTHIEWVERFFVKDSNLYLLCTGSQISPTEKRLIVVNMNTRTIIPLSTTFNTPTDIAMDDMYLYAARGNNLVRYGANTLQQDVSWGTNISNLSTFYNFRHIIPRGNKIFCLGNYGTGNTPQKEDFASLLVIDRSNSAIIHGWQYRSVLPPPFETSELFYDGVFNNDSILYVRGAFTNLGNSGLNNYVALNANTGAILNWNLSPQTALPPPYYLLTSHLKYNNGAVWVGTSYDNPDEQILGDGLHLFDSATGVRLPGLAKFRVGDIWGTGHIPSITDMLFDSNYTYISGRFDYVNDKHVNNIMRMGFKNGSPPAAGAGIGTITGTDVIVPNADSVRYHVSNANTQLYSYVWSYTGTGVTIDNNGKDTIYLKIAANATPGYLKVKTINYCGAGTETQKELTVGVVDLSINSTSVSSSSIVRGSSFTVGFTAYNIGTHPASPHKVNFYLSADTILTPSANGDLLLGQDTISTSIPGNGNSGVRSKQLLMPCNIAVGNYYIFWVADGLSEVAETSETNNTVSTPITVTAVVPSITISYSGCPNDSLLFQAIAVNGGTNPQIDWYVNYVKSGSGQNLTLRNATNGTVVYASLTSTITCANPSIAYSGFTYIHCITTAISNIDGLEEYKVMPNPSRGIFSVRLNLTTGKKVSFELKDVLGNSVYYAAPVVVSGSFIKTLNMSHLPKGIYFLTGRIGNDIVTDKIIIQ